MPPILPPPVLPEPEDDQPIDYDSLPDVGFPTWVKVAAAVVVVLVIFSIIRIPKAMQASIAEERGNRYFQQHKYADAAKEFELAEAAAPGSTRVTLPLAECYMQTNQFRLAARQLGKLDGKHLGEKDYAHAESIGRRLDQAAAEMEAREKVGVGAGK